MTDGYVLINFLYINSVVLQLHAYNMMCVCNTNKYAFSDVRQTLYAPSIASQHVHADAIGCVSINNRTPLSPLSYILQVNYIDDGRDFVARHARLIVRNEKKGGWDEREERAPVNRCE